MKDIHLNIHAYQYAYLDDNDYNISQVVRTEIDGKMIEDGADPEEWKEAHGE